MSQKTHTIWTEKYRPDTLDGYIGNEAMKAKFASYIADQDVPHLLLTGPAGTGKTTAAKILLNGIDADAMVLNASDENNIETVRNKIRGFASTRGFKPLKIMLLDEFDGFTQQGQSALRNLMEQFSLTTRFILTANYPERILPAIISRTQHFEVVPPSRVEVARHLAQALKTEGVSYQPSDVKLLIDAHFPDVRKILNEAQANTRNGKLAIDQKAVIENDFKLKVIHELTTGKSFTAIRQLIANARVRDFTEVYRTLFDHADDFGAKNIPAVILAVAEGQYRDALVVDKEINFAATILNILEAIK